MLARSVFFRARPHCQPAAPLLPRVVLGPTGSLDLATPSLAPVAASLPPSICGYPLHAPLPADRSAAGASPSDRPKALGPKSVTYWVPAPAKSTATKPDAAHASGHDLLNHVPIVLAEFDNRLSRSLGVLRTDNLQSALSSAIPSCTSSCDIAVTVVLDSPKAALPAAVAIARSFSSYTRKTSKDALAEAARNIHVNFHIAGADSDINYDEIQSIADNVRRCQELVDAPCADLHSTAFVAHARAVVDRLNTQADNLKYTCEIKVISGAELADGGFGGLMAVGRAAEYPPALVVLTRRAADKPAAQLPPVALVGKGIMFDTGGLSIKPTTGMCGMKHDMAGAAAVLSAFDAATRANVAPGRTIYALLCVAENAIGHRAYRNDDILTMRSGKTVEINNTDAEGRLVLADGVAYASSNALSPAPKTIITIATLTGAQPIATGEKHAGVLASTAELEAAALRAAASSGDLAHPLLYAPEILKSEFESSIADMKNSVKSRSNAQSSCAGHFIESHLAPEYEGGFLHLDIAGPASKSDRATGFGVALLCELIKSPSV